MLTLLQICMATIGNCILDDEDDRFDALLEILPPRLNSDLVFTMVLLRTQRNHEEKYGQKIGLGETRKRVVFICPERCESNSKQKKNRSTSSNTDIWMM